MSIKYHINSKGELARCYATKRPCRFQNFTTIDEAISYVKSQGDEVKFSSELRMQENAEELTVIPPDELSADRLAKESFNSRRSTQKGLQHECTAGSHLAIEMRLDCAVTLNDNGVTHITEKQDISKLEEYIETAKDSLEKKYTDLGVSIGARDSLVNTLYYSDYNDMILVQSGGPNVLDFAIIDNSGEVVDLVEVKDFGGGAQTSNKTLDTTVEGRFVTDNLDYTDAMKLAIDNINEYDVMGTNYPINLSKENSVLEFVRTYKSKGATKLIGMGRDNNLIAIDLTKSNERIVSQFESNDIEVSYNIRSNKNQKVMNEELIKKFDTQGDVLFYKNSDAKNREWITLKDLKEDFVYGDKALTIRNRLRLGSFTIPEKYYRDGALNKNTKIYKKDLEYMVSFISGLVKQR